MKMPTICQLCDFGPEYAGSFIDSLLYLASYCRQTMGLETFCVFPERARKRGWLKQFDKERIRYAFVPAKRNVILPLSKILSEHRPVILHSHFHTFDLDVLFLKLTVFKGAKIIWHIHSIAEVSWRQKLRDAFKTKLLASHLGDGFVCVGEGAYLNAIDRGFPREKLFLNCNGVDMVKFAKGQRTQMEHCAWLRESLHERTAFLILGYNPVVKGVDVFTKAAEKFAREARHQDLFLIVGRQATRQFVSGLPQAKGLGDALKIIDPTDNFSALLDEIDVLVAPSRSEGFGYAVVEAMAAGKLILCSDIPGVRNTYGQSEGVWLFPNEDWESLARLMRKAGSLSHADRQHLGEINSRYASEHYSMDIWAKKMGQIYDSVLSSGPKDGLLNSLTTSDEPR